MELTKGDAILQVVADRMKSVGWLDPDRTEMPIRVSGSTVLDRYKEQGFAVQTEWMDYLAKQGNE